MLTPAAHIPGLVSPKPDAGVGKPLASRLQNHEEGGTGDAEFDLPPVDIEIRFEGNENCPFDVLR